MLYWIIHYPLFKLFFLFVVAVFFLSILYQHIFLLIIQVVERFHELFAQTKYKEAAELAAESPQGILRTPATVANFQVS
jgi:hypothetical protein